MQVVSEDVGLSLDKIDMSKLGTAKKVSISKDDTIILDGGGEKDKINERCDQIRESVAASSSDYDKCAHQASSSPPVTSFCGLRSLSGFLPSAISECLHLSCCRPALAGSPPTVCACWISEQI